MQELMFNDCLEIMLEKENQTFDTVELYFTTIAKHFEVHL